MAEEQLVSMGILIDIVDEEWMQEILPKDDMPLPTAFAPKTDEADDSHHESLPTEGDVWQDLALENLP